MKTLKEFLTDWQDFDYAQNHLGVILGLWPEEGPKWIFWSRNDMGERLMGMLEIMVIGGILEQNDDMQFRWKSDVKV